MKALVGTFNQEKALEGAFSVIVKWENRLWNRWIVLQHYSRHTPFNTFSREIESLSAENVLGGKMIDWKLGLFIEMRCIVRMLRAVKISDIFLAIKGQYKKYNQFMAKSC